MGKLLIRGADLMTMRDDTFIIHDGAIVIEDDKFIFVGEEKDLPQEWEYDKIIEAKDQVIMPGMINTHTHAAMTLLRSYADDLPLMEWLEKRIWPVEARLKAEDVYWGSMVAILEMIKSGTTCFADMYFYMDEVAKAVEESGIRGVLSHGMIGVGPNGEKDLAVGRQFCKDWEGKADGRIRTMLAPHAPYTCPPDYLRKVLEIADELKVPIHIHLCETETEIKNIKEQYGKTPIQLVDEVGLFDYPVLAAHCVHLSDKDFEILKKAKALGIAHNPQSNMKLASGIAPVQRMLNEGLTVGIGTDGASSNNNLNMLEEMSTAALLQKVGTMDSTALPAGECLRMATIYGARAIGQDAELGTLEVGKKADLIIFDFSKPHLVPRHNIMAHTVYSAQSSDILTVIVNGQILMENREVKTIDEERVLFEAERTSKELLRR
ncbi:N-ethylammeline chlorohydrolase [Anoxybacter fermentans]|uniref:5-methylthioadenosine/S-adenosylhomocysteine deaminase n=1 Tax=Anoxybacter fermentans TaxID=1323375 RepID=A0A3Q9HPQ5_9FIRM|nr:amidohydrolase [Anoxybacter fermentans]AZR72695.1 N-ethylammeline chlorohydrolase [Anoxybacter fermentans]